MPIIAYPRGNFNRRADNSRIFRMEPFAEKASQTGETQEKEMF